MKMIMSPLDNVLLLLFFILNLQSYRSIECKMNCTLSNIASPCTAVDSRSIDVSPSPQRSCRSTRYRMIHRLPSRNIPPSNRTRNGTKVIATANQGKGYSADHAVSSPHRELHDLMESIRLRDLMMRGNSSEFFNDSNASFGPYPVTEYNIVLHNAQLSRGNWGIRNLHSKRRRVIQWLRDLNITNSSPKNRTKTRQIHKSEGLLHRLIH